MRIGLVTDVHNHAPELSAALAAFRRHGVDRVVTLGDTCDAFSPAQGAVAVAALLRECGAVGVWGNHDFSLCRQVSEAVRGRYDPGVLEFMAGMGPSLEIEDCHFSHEGPWIDAYDPVQMWSIQEGPTDLLDSSRRSFEASSQRCFFLGHHHRWWIATPQGRVDWDGRGPTVLDKAERHFVVVAPVFQGWCAVFDTASSVLWPIACPADASRVGAG